MAGLVATHLPQLRGVAILSGVNPFTLSASELPTPQCDILVVHGTFDEVVPLAVGHSTRDQLSERGVAVTYAEYPIGHTVDLRVIASLTRFIGERL
jgi:phospholipase/carboxylesterase